MASATHRFGSHANFATEYKVGERLEHWVFGRFCYWIAGERLGNWEDGTTLNSVLVGLEIVCRDRLRRHHDELFEMSLPDLVVTLDAGLYGSSLARAYPEEDVEERAVRECWSRFDISAVGDVFDLWRVFAVSGHNLTRIVAPNHQSGRLVEGFEQTDAFEDTLSHAAAGLLEAVEG